MAKTWTFCRRCGGRVPPGARCGCSRRDRGGEPWRSAYRDPAWPRARQAVLGRQGGRCAACGAVIAVMRGGSWSTLPGAGVHHAVPLRSGGTNDPANLAGLCGRCHARADAELRRRDLGRP